MHFVHPVTGAIWTDHVQWRGVLHEAHTRLAEAKSEIYHKKMQKLDASTDLSGMPWKTDQALSGGHAVQWQKDQRHCRNDRC